jgi:hypothetical protein
MSVCAFVRVLHLKVVSGVATNSVPGVDPAMESLTGAPLQLCPHFMLLIYILGNRSGVWGHFAQSEKL